jgi:hypothetical protein
MSRHATGLSAVLALASLTASAAPSSRVLTSLSGASLTASPAPPSRVLLVTERCPEAEMARLAGLLGAELRTGGVGEVRWLRAEEGSPTLPADEARLEVTCEAPALETAHLVARRPGAARRTERDLALVDVPEPERPRVLSLALAELLREGPRHRPPLIPVDGAAPAPPDPDSLTAAAKRGGVVAGPRVRQFLGPGTRLLGVEAELAWRALRLGASAGFGSTATGQGRIDLRVVAGHAGLALLRAEGLRLGLEVGARLEVGEVRVAGQASDARPTVLERAASRPHVAPGLFASARLRLAGPAWLQVGVASGYAWGLVANVDGNTAASTAGTWVGGSAAVRLAW